MSPEVVAEAKGDDAHARTLEAEALRKRLREREMVVALDEGGLELTSPQLAERLGKAERSAGRDLCFILGGASGLDAALKSQAEWVLSLSRFTLAPSSRPARFGRATLPLRDDLEGRTLLEIECLLLPPRTKHDPAQEDPPRRAGWLWPAP